jgi:hypothetical protein
MKKQINRGSFQVLAAPAGSTRSLFGDAVEWRGESIDDLVAAITPANRRDEISFVRPVGRELF